MPKRKREVLPPVEDLSCDAVAAKPTDRDWSEGYGESWDYVAASRCEECGEVVFHVREGEYPTHAEAVRDRPSDEDMDEERAVECEGSVPGASGPMMNSLYPIDHLRMSAESAASAIVDLPLCVVTDGGGDVLGLALTGGGMDLSWEICEAHMRLGLLPPVHFRLPRICGRGTSKRDRWIAAGMLRAIDVQVGWLERAKDDVRDALRFGRKYEREQRERRKSQKR